MLKKEQKCCFTLIELLVSKTCQICVSPLYYFQKSTPLFLKGERGAGREGNFFSREKKFPSLPAYSFTLIELLVVIAIIAILASILMPSLSSARERSKASSCMNNVKTLATACLQYADDFNSCMSRVGGINGFNNGKAWIGKCGKWSSLDLNEEGLVTPYFGNNIKAKSCPSVDGDIINKKSGLFHGGGLGLNLNFGSTGMWPIVKLVQIKAPASKIMISDVMGTYQQSNVCLGYKLTPYGNYQTGYNGTRGTGTADSCFRHNGRANVAYVDGHVTNLMPAELDISGTLAFYNVGWISTDDDNNPYRLTQWQEDWED